MFRAMDLPWIYQVVILTLALVSGWALIIYIIFKPRRSVIEQRRTSPQHSKPVTNLSPQLKCTGL